MNVSQLVVWIGSICLFLLRLQNLAIQFVTLCEKDECCFKLMKDQQNGLLEWGSVTNINKFAINKTFL